MSKKRSEINPIRAERVKTILDREGITQQKLAEMIFQTQQNVSRILTGKQPLTEETARAIIDAANKISDQNAAQKAGISLEEYGYHVTYRIEWLLGYDDKMTVEDEISGYFTLKNKAADGMWAIIEKSLVKQGKSLRFVHRQGQHVDASERVRADCYYSIVDQTGKELKRLSSVEMIEFEEKIQEYTDFLTAKYL